MILIRILLIALLIIGSIFIDGFHLYLFTVPDFDKIASIAIQIQATITTLGIALLSFLANKTDDSYYGINLSEYVFTKMNKPLTTKRVIILEMLLILPSLGLYCASFFNAVISIFIISILFTLYIFNQVSIVLKAKSKLRGIFFDTVIIEFLTDEKIVTDFFDSFADAISSKPDNIIDEYAEKATTLYDCLLKAVNKKNYRLFCENLGVVCNNLFKSKTQNHVGIGTNLLTGIFKKYRDSNFKDHNLDPDIISKCQLSICEALEIIDDSELIHAICYYLPAIVFDSEISESQEGPDVNPCFSLAKAFGYTVSKSENHIDISLMAPEITDSVLMNAYSKNEKMSKMMRFKISFAISMIQYGKAGFLFDHCIKRATKRHYGLSGEMYFNHYIISIIIYVLYICVFEKQIPITESTKQECRQLLSGLWKYARDMIEELGYEDHFSLKELENLYSSILRREELFSDEGAKWMVMDHAIRESIVILFAICVGFEQKYNSLVEEYIGNDGFVFYSIVDNKDNTCETIKTILDNLQDESYSNSTVDRNITYIDSLYSKIRTAIENGYKTGAIKHAITLEHDLGDLSKYDKEISLEFEKYVSEKTSIFHNPDVTFDKSEYSVTHQQFKQSIALDYYCNNPPSLFNSIYSPYILNTLFNLLEPLAKKEIINPNNQDDMNKFLDLLSKHTTAIGSEPSIRYENKTIKNNYQEAISKKGTLFSPYYLNKVLLINTSSNDFIFKNFSVHSRKYSDDEVLESNSIEIIGDSVYSFNITNDIWIPFSKEELLEYYSAHKRIMEFNYDVQYRITEATEISFI